MDERDGGGGPGVGQVAAESLVEIDEDGGSWTLLRGANMPHSAATYARLWGQGTGDRETR